MTETKPQSAMGRLFGGLWRVVQIFYQMFFILSLVIVGVLLWVISQGGAPIKIDENVALVIAPTGTMVEQMDQDPGERLIQNLRGDPPAQTLLRDVVEALDEGSGDARINMVVLKLDGLFDVGLPQLEELAAAVDRFKAAGKPVYAYSPFYEQSHYLLAAHASEISLDPLGIVFLEGYSVFNNYFREGLDKLGVEINVFRVGNYKSAVEPFERNDMSAEAKEANHAWLGDLWRRYSEEIAKARKIPEAAVDGYIADLNAGLKRANDDAAEYAKQSKLIDHIETLQQFRERMGKRVGMDEDHGSFRQVHYGEYLRAVRRAADKKDPEQPVVALVVVQGQIVDGSGDQGMAGGDTVAQMLDEARLNSDYEAVVVRVDSPGGSVFASEKVRRGIRQLQAENKPVVVSMSSVAASGGYWIAMDADEIWASGTTITGSIGIFALWPTFDKPLQKIGIHTDGVGTTPLAGAFRGDRPLSPEVRGLIQSQLERGYREFIDGVAQGRELTPEKVEEIAQGRVWSGEDAREIGLVDKLGGLADAVAAAGKLAGYEPGEYRMQEIRPDLELIDRVLLDFTGRSDLSWLPLRLDVPLQALGDLSRRLRWLNDPSGLYAHCFCTPGAGRRAVR